jgi:hypothetical protein
MKRAKELLYRKENKVSLSTKYYIVKGGEFRYQRNTKEFLNNDSSHAPMNSGKYGYDYTPLFKFLLSKVGKKWDIIFGEVKSRLDKEEPIFWIVALHQHEKRDIVKCGESSYYSGLFVDDQGLLQIVNPEAGLDHIKVAWFEILSFNGKPVIEKPPQDN